MSNVLEHNCETGEIIERDYTKEELEIAKATAAFDKTQKEAEAAKAAEKAALLAKLGITEDEAKLLLS